MKANQAWKNAEREASKALGGTRNIERGADFKKSAPDIHHPLFSIEVKLRALLPRILRLGLAQAKSYSAVKPPLLVLRERKSTDALVVMHLKDFVDLLGAITPEQEDA